MSNAIAVLRRTDVPRLSVSAKTTVTVLGIVAAVALPQFFHVLGAASGLGTALGSTFLPMHLPVIFVGLFAGPVVGAVTGLIAPMVSFALSGMPMLAMVPFMMIELCAYGLFAGLLRSMKLPGLAKVIIVQVAGRAVLSVATAIAIAAFDAQSSVASIWTSTLAAGLPGILLQWALVPLALFWAEHQLAKRA